MAHKTLIGGTAYEISGGKTLVNGTAYSIDKGKTLVGGTAYEVGFKKPLSDFTPAEIQAIAQSGQAANYWAVGDVVPITLNGTVGILTFSNETYYAFIIGFDHNSDIEGNNTIHFQFGKTSAGVDVAFVDGNYDVNGSTTGFVIGDSKNYKSWASSYMRSTICPAFKSVMPSVWQNVIAACTKYTYNSTKVSATQDEIFCLAEFELTGVRSEAVSGEQSYQKQYEYYKNGNSRIKYKHNSITNTSKWWTRSKWYLTTSETFVCVERDGAVEAAGVDKSYGFAPCFMVA